jgi:thiamine pyrophosphokinase|tara:strand:+ start:1193 stop:1858 length:666 start_codon:yes stop_codon:yes gene_type:complete
MLYSTQNKLLIVGGADFSEDLFYNLYEKEIPIIAADGGANFLADQSILPELIIGDLDSVEEQKIQNIETQKIIKISCQNNTDLEKVLLNTQSPLTLGIGFLGSRIDHELASLSALAKYPQKKIILVGEKDIIFLAPPNLSLSSFEGMRVSLYPLGSVRVQSSGLKWSTEGLTMNPVDLIGTSNEAVGKIIHFVPDKPKLLLIMPISSLNDAILQLELSPSW